MRGSLFFFQLAFLSASSFRLKWTITGTLITIGSLLLVFVIFEWNKERLEAFENKDRIW
ncbi:hypothetical protein [Chitinophaga niabensis]|uniref:hypothetical protein n=1 Tax=Chitinophaga niabensis TaxID=536979 RepID=UPI0013563ED8|nr:hypothetical protein [Chitinophaga niabensis]